MPWPDVASLVPHRPPMLLLDSVERIEARAITCRARIVPGGIFVDGGRADIVVCLELVAQAVAAYVGHTSQGEGGSPKLGVIVSCRDASFFARWLNAGDDLVVRAEHVWGDADMASFKGRVERQGEAIAFVELGVIRGTVDKLRGAM